MWLLIDDTRNLNADVIARTPEAGRKMLALGGWEGLMLDHDLGPCESGAAVLDWAIEHNFVPPIVDLVTSNPVGRANMARALIAAGYTPKNTCYFTKHTPSTTTDEVSGDP